jgi:DNA-binding NtrC family response regulator
VTIPRRILIVEDSVDDAELAVRSLRQSGLHLTYERVDTPETMRAALEERPWDVVLSDFSMPRFSGLDALKLLQDRGFDLPFILVSGTVGEDVAVQAMRAGAHDYFLKGNLTRLPLAVERELRDAETRREAKRAEARYRTLFNRVPVGITSTTPEGVLLAANPAFVQMLGFADVEELKRANIAEVWVNP